MLLRRLSALLVLVLVGLACTTGTVETTTTTPGPGTDTTTTSTAVMPTTTTRATPNPTPPDLSHLGGLSDEVRRQLEALIVKSEEIRELPFLEPPNILVVTETELEQRVRAQIEEDIEDLPADEALYNLLGLLDVETDLLTLLLDLYGEQVAGFYDGETGEVVVPARAEGFSILQQGTLLHELVHALTDQHFGFDKIYRQMLDEDRLDEAAAYQALIEGDATMAEVLWVQGLSREELREFAADVSAIDSTTLRSAPRFIQDSLLFPYDSGLPFVQGLFSASGWAGVNEAYSVFPGLPGSSEQIYTPDDYRRDLPVTVMIPDVEIEGYTLELTSVWGESGFRIMIDQVLGEAVGFRAADGWGGDAYHQWFDGENAALLIVYEGDTARDLDELEGALVDYVETAMAVEVSTTTTTGLEFRGEDYAFVGEISGQLVFIVAHDPAAGASILQAIGG